MTLWSQVQAVDLASFIDQVCPLVIQCEERDSDRNA